MNCFLYLILDCLDTMSIILLMLTVFQYPIREYIREIVIICALLAVSSSIIREVIDLVAIDPFVHILLLIVCLRYIVQVRWYRSIIITAVGVLGYFAVQSIVSVISIQLGFLSSSTISDSDSAAVRLIQLASQIITCSIAFVIHRFDLGRTKYIRPPHDFYLRDTISKDQIKVMVISLVALAAISAAFYAFVFHFKVIAFTVLATLLCLAVIYLTYRREKKRGPYGSG